MRYVKRKRRAGLLRDNQPREGTPQNLAYMPFWNFRDRARESRELAPVRAVKPIADKCPGLLIGVRRIRVSNRDARGESLRCVTYLGCDLECRAFVYVSGSYTIVRSIDRYFNFTPGLRSTTRYAMSAPEAQMHVLVHARAHIKGQTRFIATREEFNTGLPEPSRRPNPTRLPNPRQIPLVREVQYVVDPSERITICRHVDNSRLAGARHVWQPGKPSLKPP
jgi:hypothetical protein